MPLHWSTSVLYLGLHITSNLCWSNHCKLYTLWGANPQIKSMAYRCVVRPLLEYIWVSYLESFTQKDIKLLENIQCHAACWVCGSRWYPSMLSWTMSSDDCLRQLEWPSLKLRRDFLSVNLLYNIISNKIVIKFSDFCSFASSCTMQYSLSIFPLQSAINSLRYSFLAISRSYGTKSLSNILSLSNRNASHRAVKCYFWCFMICFIVCGCFILLLFVCVLYSMLLFAVVN